MTKAKVFHENLVVERSKGPEKPPLERKEASFVKKSRKSHSNSNNQLNKDLETYGNTRPLFMAFVFGRNCISFCTRLEGQMEANYVRTPAAPHSKLSLNSRHSKYSKLHYKHRLFLLF